MTNLAALMGALLMSGAVVRWGRAGALVGYGVGLGLCVAAWVVAAWLTTRLDGTGGGQLWDALQDGIGPATGLVVAWLLVASAGVVLGAIARVWLSRRRSRVTTR